MTIAVELIAEDVERLCRSYPDLDPRSLAEAVFEAALPHRRHEADPDDLTDQFIHDAAALSTYRHGICALSEALQHVRRQEQVAYEEALELDRDVLPPLKSEAKRLRREMFALEEALRARGIDPSAIEPAAPLAPTAVDDYEPPRFEDAHGRQASTMEFFRRVGGDR